MTNEEKAGILSGRILGFRDEKTTENFNACIEMAVWKDKQYLEEKRELLGLVKMLPKNETNQTIIEDLIALLEL